MAGVRIVDEIAKSRTRRIDRVAVAHGVTAKGLFQLPTWSGRPTATASSSNARSGVRFFDAQRQQGGTCPINHREVRSELSTEEGVTRARSTIAGTCRLHRHGVTRAQLSAPIPKRRHPDPPPTTCPQAASVKRPSLVSRHPARAVRPCSGGVACRLVRIALHQSTCPGRENPRSADHMFALGVISGQLDIALHPAPPEPEMSLRTPRMAATRMRGPRCHRLWRSQSRHEAPRRNRHADLVGRPPQRLTVPAQ